MHTQNNVKRMEECATRSDGGEKRIILKYILILAIEIEDGVCFDNKYYLLLIISSNDKCKTMQSSSCQSFSLDAVTSAESLSAMLQKERTTHRCRDYLRPTTREPLVAESDRRALVDWCYGIVDRIGLDREVVASAMGLADRFLSAPGAAADDARDALRDRRRLQLIVLTSLYVAVKVRERAAYGSDFFAVASRGIYSAGDIEAAESTVLKGLGWRVHGPTSVQVALTMLSLTLPHATLPDRTWAFLVDEVRYQCELAVRDYRFATGRPSTVALAAIFNALDLVGRGERRAMLRALLIVMQKNEDFDSPEDLLAAKKRLACLLKDNDALSEEGSVAPGAPLREVASFSSVTGLAMDDEYIRCISQQDPVTPPAARPSAVVFKLAK